MPGFVEMNVVFTQFVFEPRRRFSAGRKSCEGRMGSLVRAGNFVIPSMKEQILDFAVLLSASLNRGVRLAFLSASCVC